MIKIARLKVDIRLSDRACFGQKYSIHYTEEKLEELYFTKKIISSIFDALSYIEN